MKAILVRIGVDQTYGGWNAPVAPGTGEFAYVPIPEKTGTRFRPDCRRPYGEVREPLDAFARKYGLASCKDLGWPATLNTRSMHLDPDFEHLTYGDVGDRRGSEIRRLSEDDLLVFYAGLRPIHPCDHRLIYAIVGLFVVDDVVWASDVPPAHRDRNAHTRKCRTGATDIVVRAKPKDSGRLARCLPIGEYRAGAYRVRRDLLDAWGGLSVNDGYLQRSARPPRFNVPERFYDWFQNQQIPLLRTNNLLPGDSDVILVHLRQPEASNSNEGRSDPFWEFGSFGCTGCHRDNILHPDRAHEVVGARLGFTQSGPDEMKLVMLTPPVGVIRHGTRCEARWTPADMPFRYDAAPLLIDNRGRSDFPKLRKLLRDTNRSTWISAFSSKFRARRLPLPQAIASEIQQAYDRRRWEASTEELARSYVDAMPYPPNNPDRSRQAVYKRLLRESKGRSARKDGCRPVRPRSSCSAVSRRC